MSSSRRSRSRRLKQMLANAFVAVLGVITLLLLVGLFLPHQYRVERRLEMRAKPEVIYPLLSGLRHWPEWTVWNREMDPGVEFTFGSPDQGLGAEYRWTGPKLGRGWLKITKAEPDKSVAYDLSFDEGMPVSTGSLTIVPEGDHVAVVWSNEGHLGKNPINRYFGLFMDRMVGPDFEKGLERLRAKAEGTGASN